MHAAISKDKAYFCPKCGTPAITLSLLSGGEASCEKCDWAGNNTELVSFSFEHDMGSPEMISRAFANDIRAVFTQTAIPLGRVLMKWGFFRAAPTPIELARYLTVATRAALRAIIEERQNMEKENG